MKIDENAILAQLDCNTALDMYNPVNSWCPYFYEMFG